MAKHEQEHERGLWVGRRDCSSPRWEFRTSYQVGTSSQNWSPTWGFERGYICDLNTDSFHRIFGLTLNPGECVRVKSSTMERLGLRVERYKEEV